MRTEHRPVNQLESDLGRPIDPVFLKQLQMSIGTIGAKSSVVLHPQIDAGLRYVYRRDVIESVVSGGVLEGTSSYEEVVSRLGMLGIIDEEQAKEDLNVQVLDLHIAATKRDNTPRLTVRLTRENESGTSVLLEEKSAFQRAAGLQVFDRIYKKTSSKEPAQKVIAGDTSPATRFEYDEITKKLNDRFKGKTIALKGVGKIKSPL